MSNEYQITAIQDYLGKINEILYLLDRAKGGDTLILIQICFHLLRDIQVAYKHAGELGYPKFLTDDAVEKVIDLQKGLADFKRELRGAITFWDTISSINGLIEEAHSLKILLTEEERKAVEKYRC